MNVRFTTRTLGMLIIMLWASTGSAADLPTCLWISSYHQGYAWEDGIERGITSRLKDRCRLQTFRMNTKRQKDPASIQQKVSEALDLIERLKPSVVIASDDNVSKYIVKPHLKDGPLPVVFCGVNWNGEKYGYPYSNATGMVEQFSYQEVIKAIRAIVGKEAKRGLFIAAKTTSAHINSDNLTPRFRQQGITLESRFVGNLEEWQQAVLAGQDHDFIYQISDAGIQHWDMDEAAAFMRQHNRRLSISSNHWMYPITMLLVAKQAEEQGEWAAEVALEVLSGTPIDTIPVISNHRWDLYLNLGLLEKAGFVIPRDMLADSLPYKPAN